MSGQSIATSRATALRLLSSWATVTAPDSTTSTHGWDRAAASASASIVRPSSCSCCPERAHVRAFGLVGKATVGERFLDDHAPSLSLCLGQSGPCRWLEQIPGGLHDLKWIDAVDTDPNGTPD